VATRRAHRTPRILDQTIRLPDYDGPLRQLVVADLGHEEPTLLLTNQLRRSPVQLIGRYAQRMLIENGIDFFHMDALSFQERRRMRTGPRPRKVIGAAASS
jgi:hypothetical protein